MVDHASEWHVCTGDISTFTINTAGISGLAAYTAHSPYEFQVSALPEDSAGNDVEHVAEEAAVATVTMVTTVMMTTTITMTTVMMTMMVTRTMETMTKKRCMLKMYLAMFDSNSDGYLSLEELWKAWSQWKMKMTTP